MGAAIPVKITIGDKTTLGDSAEASDTGGDILAFTVERDMGQPDMAAIVLSNQEANWSTKIKVTDKVEIKVGDDETSIYVGEVTGLEGHYKGGEKSRLTIRAMNKMHLLLRKRKSVTFVDKSDQEILNQVSGDAGLTLDWKHEKTITYKHVYQHNQTNLEFVRMRAARVGCHVWCVDSKLFVKEPDLSQGEQATLEVGKTTAAIRQFTPRLSSTSILNKVTVKGWNPETKELLQGDYTAQSSNLGKENAMTGSGKHGEDETFTVDHPIWSVDEAKALAKARLVDLSLSYITGECEIAGDPKLDLGKVVKIVASAEAESAEDPFNGKYYIMGLTHRYSLSKTKDGGYVTILRLARDAQKEKA